MCIHFLYCVYMVLNNQQNSVCQFKSNPSNKKKRKKLQTWLLDIQRQFYDNVIFIVVNICLGWGSQYLQKKHVRDFTSKSFPFTISYINAVYCGFSLHPISLYLYQPGFSSLQTFARYLLLFLGFYSFYLRLFIPDFGTESLVGTLMGV